MRNMNNIIRHSNYTLYNSPCLIFSEKEGEKRKNYELIN